MKKFDLEKALKGEPVITRGGLKAHVRFVETKLDVPHPILGFVEFTEGNLSWDWDIRGLNNIDSMDTSLDIVGMWSELLTFEHWDLLCEDIKYLAKDNEENWWGYVLKPVQNKVHGEWVTESMYVDCLTPDAFELEGLNPKLFPECDWKYSLIKRPEK